MLPTCLGVLKPHVYAQPFLGKLCLTMHTPRRLLHNDGARNEETPRQCLWTLKRCQH